MIVWILKSGLWLALFWAVWRLLLSRETFHRFNRWYLIAALSLSFVLPAVEFHYVREIAVTSLPQIVAASPEAMPSGEPVRTFDWGILMIAAYMAGVVIIAAGAARRWLQVRKLIRTHGFTQHDGYRLVDVAGGTPFSFGRYIFLDPAEPGRDIILAHELAHIRDRHRVDLLLAGVVCAVQWFNPFARLAMRAVRDNHEYIADDAVLAQGYSRGIYKAILINNALGSRVFALGHTLIGKTNLKRYAMMNRKISPNKRKLAVFAILPAAAVVLAAFATPRYVVVPVPVEEKIEQPSVAVTPDNDIVTDVMPTVKVKTADPVQVQKNEAGDKKNVGEVVVAKLESSSVIERVNELSGREIDQIPMFIIDGYEAPLEKFMELDEETVQSMTIFKDAAAVTLHGDRAKNGVVIVETGKKPENRPPALVVTGDNLKRLNDDSAKNGVEVINKKTEKTPRAVIVKGDDLKHLNDANVRVVSQGLVSLSDVEHNATLQADSDGNVVIPNGSDNKMYLIVNGQKVEVSADTLKLKSADVKTIFIKKDNAAAMGLIDGEPFTGNAAIYIKKSDLSKGTGTTYVKAEKMPKFPEGDFHKWVMNHVQYPQGAFDNGIEGVVSANFVIETDGTVSNVQITSDTDPLLNNEVVRVINMSPKWEPGKQGDKPVRVIMNCNKITFRLQ